MKTLSEDTIKLFRSKNQKRIVNLMIERIKINQVDIAKELSLSLPTVISNVNLLTKEGVLTSDGVGNSRGGRKPIVVGICPEYRYSIGIDFLVDTIRISIFNFIMHVVSTKDYYPLKSFDFDQIMSELFVIIKDMLLEHNIVLSKVLGIGISIPGIVNEETKKIEVAPNLQIADKQLTSYNNLFGVPVFFENEANAAAYAEWQIGSAKAAKEVLYLSIMKGVGAGLIIGNKLYHGAHFKAGEVGHIIIHRNGLKCTCGEYGCANEYLSLKALMSRYSHKSGLRNPTLLEFMDSVKHHDEIAMKIWKEYIEDFAFTIKTIISTIDPQTIVIGGGIAQYAEILIPLLQHEVKKSISSVIKKDYHIVPSLLMSDASIIGVALYIRNRVIL